MSIVGTLVNVVKNNPKKIAAAGIVVGSALAYLGVRRYRRGGGTNAETHAARVPDEVLAA